ncbi:Phytoene dehydrogenase, chloroplastic/chromoplastic [Symbiodinium microadriaticum]|uniref:Amine oxidase n=1 Tax=Symbiodinium microadriaticum TaxID=2951 RepID=A0A1Q9ES61_SYMMI|nr:Phytoene dehydrogenase, chloroplastic/chromoplastic [Symbiodinium microadriaticum]
MQELGQYCMTLRKQHASERKLLLQPLVRPHAMSLTFVQGLPLQGVSAPALSKAGVKAMEWAPGPSADFWTALCLASAGAVAARSRQRKTAIKAETRTRTVNPANNEPEDPKDFPKPSMIDKTDNYLEGQALSSKIAGLKGKGESKTVAIIGGGLSGLACAKYLVDAGHKPIVLEARGKVSAWQDKDGDWVETGLHIFFGAYPNMMNLFKELDIEDRLQWKRHQMIFAMQELPGEFTTFDFLEGIPAPFNFGLSILLNQKMLTLPEKLQTAPALLPMLVEGQKFIDLQDELSATWQVFNFMEKYGMPDRINTEVFIAMAKALDFIDPETVVLTAMNRFLNETDGIPTCLQMAFLDGNQTLRLCEPMKQYIEARGGQVLLNKPLASIETNEDGSVKHFLMRDGEKVVADEYISSVPCDIMKRILPKAWSTDPFFRQIDELEGKEYEDQAHSIFFWLGMHENGLGNSAGQVDARAGLCSLLANRRMGKSDQDIVDATMKELERLFPTEIGPHLPDGALSHLSDATGGAKLIKHAVVKARKFLGSMEGAVLGGKLAAEGLKAIDESILAKKDEFVPKDPMGVKGKCNMAQEEMEDQKLRYGEDLVSANAGVAVARPTAKSAPTWQKMVGHSRLGKVRAADASAGNFARNISCKTCGAQRPIAGSYGTPLPSAGQTDPFESPTGQPGDWSCPKCRAVCFARNPVCGRCNCPKPESIEEYNLLAAAAVGAIPGVKASVKGYVPPTAELKTDATSPWARQWAAGPAGGMFVGETNLPAWLRGSPPEDKKNSSSSSGSGQAAKKQKTGEKTGEAKAAPKKKVVKIKKKYSGLSKEEVVKKKAEEEEEKRQQMRERRKGRVISVD